MKKGKNFFYKINPSEVLAELISVANKEEWLISFLIELKADDYEKAKIPLAKDIIKEAHDYRETRRKGGVSRGKQIIAHGKHMLKDGKQEVASAKPVALAVHKETYKEIIDDLNAKGGFRYQVCNSVISIINGRLSEGFTKEDFFLVHSNMIGHWGGDPKMNQYLRPATLYLASKFQGYLNQKPKAQTKRIMNADGEWIEVPV